MAQLDDRKAITVAELRERLAAFPDDFHVHLDFMVEDVRQGLTEVSKFILITVG